MITEIDSLESYKDLIDRIAADPRYSDPHFTYDPQNLYSALQKPDHRVYASSEDGAVNGIFAWVILPEDRYAELITGLSEDTTAWEEMLGLIERENPGIQMDFVINPKHDVLRGILQRRGAAFEKEQKKFRLVRETEAEDDPETDVLLSVRETEAEDNLAVGELQPEYEDQYREVHAKDTYWTAEWRNCISRVSFSLKSPQKGSSGCRMIPSSSAAAKAASGGHHEWKRTWFRP